MRLRDHTEGHLPVLIDVYRTHRDEIVGVVFAFRGHAHAFAGHVREANRQRAESGLSTTAMRLYRLRIKKLKLVGEKP